MKTTIYTIKDLYKDETYQNIAQVINDGGLVVFPTETVYGIGANALDKNASRKIYQVKGRPSDNPLIVHISTIDEVFKYVTEVNELGKKLMRVFWPGPLTLILKKNELIPDEITGGLKTVAIRIPNNEIALRIIKAAKTPICAPSANISGKPSSTLFNHVIEDFSGKVDIIIDGGQTTIGLESTVLDVTGETPIILRPGAITQEMIEEVLNQRIMIEKSDLSQLDIPKSPGMKYTHYSPKGKMFIAYGNKQKVIDFINQEVVEKEKTYKVAVICATEYQAQIKAKEKFVIGSLMNPEEIAANLFIALRKMDELKIEYIYTHSFPTNNIGYATMNRLLKASGNNVIILD